MMELTSSKGESVQIVEIKKLPGASLALFGLELRSANDHAI